MVSQNKSAPGLALFIKNVVFNRNPGRKAGGQNDKMAGNLPKSGSAPTRVPRELKDKPAALGKPAIKAAQNREFSSAFWFI